MFSASTGSNALNVLGRKGEGHSSLSSNLQMTLPRSHTFSLCGKITVEQAWNLDEWVCNITETCSTTASKEAAWYTFGTSSRTACHCLCANQQTIMLQPNNLFYHMLTFPPLIFSFPVQLVKKAMTTYNGCTWQNSWVFQNHPRSTQLYVHIIVRSIFITLATYCDVTEQMARATKKPFSFSLNNQLQ